MMQETFSIHKAPGFARKAASKIKDGQCERGSLDRAAFPACMHDEPCLCALARQVCVEGSQSAAVRTFGAAFAAISCHSQTYRFMVDQPGATYYFNACASHGTKELKTGKEHP